MLQKKWLDLQLFAEGGDGGGEGSSVGGESAASPADDGQAKLRELGVPESKIRKRASAKASEQNTQPEAHVEQDAAVQQPTEAKRMTWDEIMADPEYNKHMQETVKASKKKAKEEIAAERAKYAPMLEVLANRYNLDAQNLDIDALVKAVNDDNEFYEQRALEMGVPVENAKQLDQQKREQERNKVAEQGRAEEEAFDAHIAKLEQQGEALKAVFPQFDLRTELQNPTFKRLTAPGVGLSVEDAYHAVHRKEIAAAQSAAVAQKTARQISDTIIAGQRRPTENGTSARAASVTTFDYSKASAAQRNAIKQQIRDAAARGVKLRPEDIIL